MLHFPLPTDPPAFNLPSHVYYFTSYMLIMELASRLASMIYFHQHPRESVIETSLIFVDASHVPLWKDVYLSLPFPYSFLC